MGVQRLKPTAGGATIKSIQRGELTLSGTNPSATATITAVSTALALLSLLGFRTQISTINNCFVNLVLTNSTTLTLTRTDASNGVTIASYEVTEWQQ